MRLIAPLILCLALTGCAGQIGDFDALFNDAADVHFFDPLSELQYRLADAILDANDGSR